MFLNNNSGNKLNSARNVLDVTHHPTTLQGRVIQFLKQHQLGYTKQQHINHIIYSKNLQFNLSLSDLSCPNTMQRSKPAMIVASYEEQEHMIGQTTTNRYLIHGRLNISQ